MTLFLITASIQEKFAEGCGIKLHAQGMYERGRRSPNSDYLIRASKLGVDVHYLITGKTTDQKSDILDFVESLDDNAKTALIRLIEPIAAAIANKKTPS